MIRFKTPETASEWPEVDLRVRILVWAVEAVFLRHGVDQVEVTDLRRPYDPDNPGSPHPWDRAGDISVRGVPRAAILEALSDVNITYQDPRGEVLSLILEVRTRAELDELMGPAFPDGGAVLINPDATAPHLHAQAPAVDTPDWLTLPGTTGIAPELEEAPMVHDDQPQEGPGIRALIEEFITEEPAPPAEGRPHVASKPKDLSEHGAWLESGRARPVEHELAVFRDTEAGDCYGLTEDGHLVTGFLHTTLGAVPSTVLHQSELERVLGKVRHGALGVLALLQSPVAGAIAKVVGLDLGPATAVTGALAQRGRGAQAAALIDLVGSRKLQAWKDEAQRRLADGELDAADKAALLEYWA